MYFIPYGNRLYKQLITLSCRQRIVATTATLLLIVGSWFFCIYVPVGNLTNKYLHQSENATMHGQEILVTRERCNTLQTTIENEQAQLASYHTPQKGSSHYLPTITSLAKRCGICLETCFIEPQKETVSLNLEGHGTLAQLTDFYNNLCTSYPLLVAEQLALNLIKNTVYHLTMNLTIKNLHDH